MTALDGRLEVFSAEERFLDLVLGLSSMGRRVEALAAVRRADAARSPDGDLVYFFLGVVSASRTLRAALGAAAATTREDSPSPASPSLSEVLSLR